MNLSSGEKSALVSTAQAISVPWEWLFSLIRHESGFNPQAKNPLSSARGLIQFTDATARSLGYNDSLDLVSKNPTIEKQLTGPVKKYLEKFRPFPTEQSFYLSVFYPPARTISPNTLFPATVRAVNPGINTPQDYINRVKGISAAAGGGLVLIIAAAIGFYLWQRRKK